MLTQAPQNKILFAFQHALQQKFLSKNSELNEAFNLLDKNSDGKIDEEEFTKAFTSMNPQMKQSEAISEAKRLFKIADSDQNGYIDFEEWC